MPAAWPASLPQLPLAEGYGEERQDNASRFQPELGPPMSRRRGTAAPTAVRWPLVLTSDELDTFETFFNDTLKDGTLSFTHTHPRRQTAATFVFAAPYSGPAPVGGGGHWRVLLPLLELA